MKAKLKPMPSLRSDTEAERFVAIADLTQFDLSEFKPAQFEIQPKTAVIHMRLPEALLIAVKQKAQSAGVPYTRYVRMLIERDLSR
ncbi:MAG: BrnA antitoxin family protein [Pigmentiphaga sp.]|nr:BrnA antitoxin family protein [Pigmentiphaga sp.]